jgi:dynein heavy chain
MQLYISGKRMTIFVDDVNLPEINEWGDQVTNEFFRSVVGNVFSL